MLFRSSTCYLGLLVSLSHSDNQTRIFVRKMSNNYTKVYNKINIKYKNTINIDILALNNDISNVLVIWNKTNSHYVIIQFIAITQWIHEMILSNTNISIAIMAIAIYSMNNMLEIEEYMVKSLISCVYVINHISHQSVINIANTTLYRMKYFIFLKRNWFVHWISMSGTQKSRHFQDYIIIRHFFITYSNMAFHHHLNAIHNTLDCQI